jgi:hypothetical protein
MEDCVREGIYEAVFPKGVSLLNPSGILSSEHSIYFSSKNSSLPSILRTPYTQSVRYSCRFMIKCYKTLYSERCLLLVTIDAT